MFELFQLRCFATVAEELHYGRAAARLFMTQPPLSRQIQLLEHSLGVTLLERTSRSVRLTAAGQVFYADAVSILRHAEQAAVQASRIDKGEAGRVTIGFTAVAGYELIPRLIAAAQQSLPNIDVVLRELVSKDQFEALESGLIDIGMVRPLVRDQVLHQHLLLREPLVLAVPDTHPLAVRRQVRPEDLDGEALVMYSTHDGKYFHDLIAGMLAIAKVRPRYVQHIGQTHTILALVRGRVGMAIVPTSAMTLPLPGIVFKPLWKSGVAAELNLVWRTQHRNPAVATMTRFAIEHYGMDVAQSRRAPRKENTSSADGSGTSDGKL